MIIAEIATNEVIENPIVNDAPFGFKIIPFVYSTADYWVDIFGAPDESYNIQAIIVSLLENLSTPYVVVYSYNDYVAQEKSYYYSAVDAVLYIHYDHDIDPIEALMELGTAVGFSNKGLVYIDDIEYLPLIESIPSFAKKVDLFNYKDLNLFTGNIVFRNTGGLLDYLITKKIYGNDLKLYKLNDQPGIIDYTRTDLEGLNCFTVDNYSLSEKQVNIILGDKRASQNIDIPVDKFTIDEYPDIDENYIGAIIHVAWGTIYRSGAIPVDGDAGSGSVTYRQALILTSLGTVQVKIDEVWTTKVPTSTDLPTGSFTLAEADGRNASGAPYECRVSGSVGIPITYDSDIIIDMNERYLEIEYLASTYDTTEWESEETSLPAGGLVLTEQKKMFEVIAMIQNGAAVGFRYDILPDGRRTIRIDDNDRAIAYNIHSEDILNIDDLPVPTDKEQLAGIVVVKYAKDYNSGVHQQYTDDSQSSDVKQKYRVIPTITNETLIQAELIAQSKAEWLVDRVKDIPLLPQVVVNGKGWDHVRLLDIVKVALTPSENDFSRSKILNGREYYGFWKAKVVGTNPSDNSLSNSLDLYLIEKYDPVNAILTGTGVDGKTIILITENNQKIIVREE